jgi:hypothetical protein
LSQLKPPKLPDEYEMLLSVECFPMATKDTKSAGDASDGLEDGVVMLASAHTEVELSLDVLVLG